MGERTNIFCIVADVAAVANLPQLKMKCSIIIEEIEHNFVLVQYILISSVYIYI